MLKYILIIPVRWYQDEQRHACYYSGNTEFSVYPLRYDQTLTAEEIGQLMGGN